MGWPVAIVPRRVNGCFDDVLFDFIAGSDGFVPRIYSDQRGIPTIGLGYAMLDNTPGWPPRDSLERDLAGIGIKLSPADRYRLTAVGEALSCHDLAQARNLVAGWTAGEEPGSKNSFSFAITRDQAQALFELIRPDYEDCLRRRLGHDLSDALENSRELVALSSLAYNNPALVGPSLSAALHSGAREKAWFEILFGSNRARHRGLQKRRNHEAKMFGLTNAQPSEAECAAIVDFLREKRVTMRRYMKDFGFSEPDIDITLMGLSASIGVAKVA